MLVLIFSLFLMCTYVYGMVLFSMLSNFVILEFSIFLLIFSFTNMSGILVITFWEFIIRNIFTCFELMMFVKFRLLIRGFLKEKMVTGGMVCVYLFSLFLMSNVKVASSLCSVIVMFKVSFLYFLINFWIFSIIDSVSFGMFVFGVLNSFKNLYLILGCMYVGLFFFLIGINKFL